MEDFSEGTILHHVKNRFVNEQAIYTYVGEVILAINPYQKLDIYGEKYLNTYIDNVKNDETQASSTPHVYGVAGRAFKTLSVTGKSQSVLISGESGAGKTETTKKVLYFLSELIPSSKNNIDDDSDTSVSIEKKIMSSNPILESFGNAKTVMNDNSSRFGKLMEIMFDGPRRRSLPTLKEWRIKGAKITNYILEKSRVTNQASGERNFHIFYMILHGLSNEKLRELDLGNGGGDSVRHFKYIKGAENKTYVLEDRDEKAEYDEMVVAFEKLGVEKDTVQLLINLLAAILHLGNIKFIADLRTNRRNSGQDNPSCISDDTRKHLQTAATLLGCEASTMENSL